MCQHNPVTKYNVISGKKCFRFRFLNEKYAYILIVIKRAVPFAFKHLHSNFCMIKKRKAFLELTDIKTSFLPQSYLD